MSDLKKPLKIGFVLVLLMTGTVANPTEYGKDVVAQIPLGTKNFDEYCKTECNAKFLIPENCLTKLFSQFNRSKELQKSDANECTKSCEEYGKMEAIKFGELLSKNICQRNNDTSIDAMKNCCMYQTKYGCNTQFKNDTLKNKCMAACIDVPLPDEPQHQEDIQSIGDNRRRY